VNNKGESMIEIVNVGKSFGNLKVLDGINLKIETGMIYGLVGQSGAGKSTLLRCINGLEQYDCGSILVDGVKVEDLNGHEIRNFRKDIGMIFQHFSLIDRKTVYKNIAFPLECWGYKKDYINQRVKELVQIVGLEDKIHARPSELSGGQKQRVAIARALALKPKYILSDESTSALDPNTTKSILSLMRQISRDMNITVVVVTHEMDVVQSICDELSILEQGKITESGSVAKLFTDKPKALLRLLGEKEMVLPKNGVNIRININLDKECKLISQLGKSISGDFKLLDSEFYNYDSTRFNNMTINIDDKDFDKTINFLSEKNIKFKVLTKEEVADGCK